MFDSPFDFFALVIALVAFIFARKAFNQTASLRARLDAIEASGLRAKSAPATSGPPPLPPAPETASPSVSPDIAAERPATIDDGATIAAAAEGEGAGPKDAAGGAAAMPPAPRGRT